MSQQSLRQESFRAIHEGDGASYNADERLALLTELDDLLASGSENSTLIRWLQLRLDTTEDNLNGLLWQFADAYGADKWVALGTFPPFALPGQIIATLFSNTQDFKPATLLLATVHEASLYADPDTFGAAAWRHAYAATKAVNTSTLYPPALVHSLRATLYADADAFHGADIPRAFPATLWANAQGYKSHAFGSVIAATKYADPDAFGTHALAMAYAATLHQNAQAYHDHAFRHAYAAAKAVNAQDFGTHAWSHRYPATLYQNPQAYGSHDLSGGMAAIKFADPDAFGSHVWAHRYPATKAVNAASFKAAAFRHSYAIAKATNAPDFKGADWFHDYAATLWANTQSFGSHELSAAAAGIVVESVTDTPQSGGLSFDMPATRPDGDLYIAFFSLDHRDDLTVSGWTPLFEATENGSTQKAYAAWRIGASEPASYAFTYDSTELGHVVVVRLSGIDAIDPINIVSTVATGFGTSAIAPSVTPDANNTLLFRFFTVDTDSIGSPPATVQINNPGGSGNQGQAICTEDGPASGNPSGTSTATGFDDDWIAVTIAINPG